jgi:predicted amidohydrolase YtcJ
VEELIRLRDLYTSGRLTAGTAKIFVDGILEARTATLLEPYEAGPSAGY